MQVNDAYFSQLEDGSATPLILGKLTKDMKAATATLTPKEARFLVDNEVPNQVSFWGWRLLSDFGSVCGGMAPCLRIVQSWDRAGNGLAIVIPVAATAC